MGELPAIPEGGLVNPPPKPRLKGPWVKGQSGNPLGRPKGAKNKITLMKLALEGELRTQLSPHMAEVIAKAIQMAKDGDPQMIKLLVDKTVPTTKAADEETSAEPKINIQIGRLPDRADEQIPIQGEVLRNG